MKKLQIIFICLPLFVTISLNGFAQERLQSIEKGISLLGDSKTNLLSYIINKGFHFNNQTKYGDIIAYSKQARYGESFFSFNLENKKIAGITWQEDQVLGQEYLTSLREANFQIELHVFDGSKFGQPDVKTFVCKNYSRNILVDLMFKADEHYFKITVAKINFSQPIEQQNQSSTHQSTVNPDQTSTNIDIPDMAIQKGISENIAYTKYSAVSLDFFEYKYQPMPFIIYFCDPKATLQGKTVDSNGQPLVGGVYFLNNKESVYEIFKLRFKRITKLNNTREFYFYDLTVAETNNEKKFTTLVVSKMLNPFDFKGKPYYYQFSLGDTTDNYKMTFYSNIVK